MEIERSIKIMKLAEKIQNEMMKDDDFKDCEMNEMKVNIDKNEVTFSFTKKGHVSLIADT